jgi:hypothetical protein
VKTVADPAVVQSLKERLAGLTPESRGRWGSLTAHEMLCHLGDAAEMVLRTRPRDKPLPPRSRPVIKWLVLWTSLRWPHGWPTSPAHDPRRNGTRPTEFVVDRRRAEAGIDGIAAARSEMLEPVHGVFGTMTVVDWQRWAYKHTDHHLRQFGL